MTILWCGGEDIDFTTVPTVYTGSYHRSSYARCSLRSTVSSPSFAEKQSLWISMRCYIHSSGSGTIWHFAAADKGKYILVYRDNFYYYLSLYDGDYNNVDQSSGTYGGEIAKMDLEIVNYGSNGTVRFYHNGAQIMSYTGDITLSSVTGFTYFRGWFQSLYSEGSEIIVADEDTRLMSLKTLAPNAAGDLNEWTGAYTDVDEVAKSDADTIYTSSGSKSFQLNLTGMPTGNFKVKAVKVAARMADGTGKLDIKAGVKTNSVVHLGNQRGLEAAWNTIEELFTTNPETTDEWTGSEIGSLQAAFQSVSTTTSTTTTT